MLDYAERSLVDSGDPTKRSPELKLKVEKLHDLFEAEVEESGLNPEPFLFPAEMPQP